jgi:signal transduction histidine kinase
MQAALEGRPWDLVLSDYSMPRFSAPAALALVKGRGLDVPFIIVSGTVGEETAVAAMRAGAHDFMPKGAFARLLPAIERELREAAGRAEAKAMREQLLISERMASVGMLAASVAHEINNPLAVLAANVELAAQSLAQFAEEGGAGRLSEAREQLSDAQDAAERVRRIVRDLKVFSRSTDAEQRGSVDIEHVLESSMRMASNEIRHRARLTKDLRGVPLADANEARLGQVFLNLIVNAAQAIPEGRTAENEITVSTRLAEDGRIVAEISDTGVGIPPHILPHIFDPFFTTKPAGVGTGLGLAICRRIVEGLGGEIAVESAPNRGTTFRVTLPRAQAAAPQAQSVAADAVAALRGRVLVVDDEPMLCSVIKRILGEAHDVVLTASAAQALARITGGESFDVILSDLMMPDMTGMDLHAALLRAAPDQAERMIFMTGGAFSPEAAAFLGRVSNASLEKPFKPAALRQIVQSRLS